MAERTLGLDVLFQVAGKYGVPGLTYGDALKNALLNAKGSLVNTGVGSWADCVYAASGTCGEDTHRATITLYGALQDDFGGDVNLTELVALFIENVSATAGYDIWLRTGVTNPLSTLFFSTADRVLIKKGGTIGLFAPESGFLVSPGALTLALEAAGAYNASWKLMAIGRNERA